jgi:glycosyltransferase involved in cell wall biosynthesis
MASGLPVIVTNFSGPTAFATPDNALLLPCARRDGAADAPRAHADGELDSCEPDEAALAAIMASLVERGRPAARALGARARESVVRRFSPEVVGALIERRAREALARRAATLRYEPSRH